MIIVLTLFLAIHRILPHLYFLLVRHPQLLCASDLVVARPVGQVFGYQLYYPAGPSAVLLPEYSGGVILDELVSQMELLHLHLADLEGMLHSTRRQD